VLILVLSTLSPASCTHARSLLYCPYFRAESLFQPVYSCLFLFFRSAFSNTFPTPQIDPCIHPDGSFCPSSPSFSTTQQYAYSLHLIPVPQRNNAQFSFRHLSINPSSSSSTATINLSFPSSQLATSVHFPPHGFRLSPPGLLSPTFQRLLSRRSVPPSSD